MKHLSELIPEAFTPDGVNEGVDTGVCQRDRHGPVVVPRAEVYGPTHAVD